MTESDRSWHQRRHPRGRHPHQLCHYRLRLPHRGRRGRRRRRGGGCGSEKGVRRRRRRGGGCGIREGETVMGLTTSDGVHLGLRTDRLDTTWPDGLMNQDTEYINTPSIGRKHRTRKSTPVSPCPPGVRLRASTPTLATFMSWSCPFSQEARPRPSQGPGSS